MRLTAEDLELLEHCYITPPVATAAGLYRVPSIEGCELVGRKHGNCAGIAFPCFWPGTSDVSVVRLRLDDPPVDPGGKTAYKYLAAPGSRNRIYAVLEDPADLTDPHKPLHISEGEKKYLALHRAALEAGGNGTGPAAFASFSLFGVSSWRGVIGIRTDSNGLRAPDYGVIPDLDRVVWAIPDGHGGWALRRLVYLVFDTNVLSNRHVAAARHSLARELERRGAEVWYVHLPPEEGINGVDDYLARYGWGGYMDLVRHAARFDWRDELVRTEQGKIMGTIGNTLLALRVAPAMQDVLRFNQFALQIETARTPPWGGEAGAWGDQDDILLTEWLEHQGIRVSDAVAAKAASTIARGAGYHPVRQYLERLHWDGVGRLDDWLITYCGADPGSPDEDKQGPLGDYLRAIGPRWMISAAARVFEPGCRADHTLILEGAQGIGKSTTFQILGGDFYSDDIAELGTKDAQLATAGVWIVELPELDAMSRAEVSKVKAFLSRKEDHFRPPYERHQGWFPRQCVFGGSVNQSQYLKDETGGRRFWPLKCGPVELARLRQDRDQLWAEAVARYRKGEPWWLNTTELTQIACEQQNERYQPHPWDSVIERWVTKDRLTSTDPPEVTTANVLQYAINKDKGHWERRDEIQVGISLNRLGWFATLRPRNADGSRRRVYTYQPPPQNQPKKE